MQRVIARSITSDNWFKSNSSDCYLTACFHKCCEAKGAIIVLVYTVLEHVFEHVFGGYTSKGLAINKRCHWIAQKDEIRCQGGKHKVCCL